MGHGWLSFVRKEVMLKRVLVGALSFYIGFVVVFLITNNPNGSNSIVDDIVQPVYKKPELLNKKYEEQISEFTTDSRHVVRIHTLKGEFFCSGFIISDEYVLTAGHCLSDMTAFGPSSLKEEPVQIRNVYGEIIDGEALPAGINPRLDWGIIRGNFKDNPRIELLTEDIVTMGESYVYTYIACGFPMGQKKIFCSIVRPQGLNGFMIEGPGAVFPGMSGGPVMGLNEQKIVGIISYATAGRVGFAPLVGILADFYIE